MYQFFGKIWCSHGSSASPLILGEDLKISDQNNLGWGAWAKNWFWGGAKFKGGPKILGGCYEPQWCHGCCVKRYSFMFVRFYVHIHSLCQLILCKRRLKCVTITNMFVFWSARLSCLNVCQSNFNGWSRSQGKYRATPEFKSSGCPVSNNLIYDSSLSLSVSIKVIPKSFDTLIQPSAIASSRWGRG